MTCHSRCLNRRPSSSSSSSPGRSWRSCRPRPRPYRVVTLPAREPEAERVLDRGRRRVHPVTSTLMQSNLPTLSAPREPRRRSPQEGREGLRRLRETEIDRQDRPLERAPVGDLAPPLGQGALRLAPRAEPTAPVPRPKLLLLAAPAAPTPAACHRPRRCRGLCPSGTSRRRGRSRPRVPPSRAPTPARSTSPAKAAAQLSRRQLVSLIGRSHVARKPERTAEVASGRTAEAPPLLTRRAPWRDPPQYHRTVRPRPRGSPSRAGASSACRSRGRDGQERSRHPRPIQAMQLACRRILPSSNFAHA